MPTIVSDEQVFPAPGTEVPKGVIKVTLRRIREDNGRERDQFIWKRPKFVVVVAVSNGSIFLKEEFKYAAFENVLTFAAGGIKPDESPEEAAHRELGEEFGMVSGPMICLCRDLSNCPDKSTEIHDVYLAMDAQPAPHLQQEKEKGEIISVPLENSLDLLDNPQMKVVIQRLALFEVWRYLRSLR